MTLQQLFDWIQTQPMVVVYYFLIIFLITLLASNFAKSEAYLSPWNKLYTLIIYGVCIPGIFAVTLSIYFFLFEKRSILQTDLLLQVLPIAMMLLTLYVIKKTVNLNLIPGFEKLNNLMMIIGILLSLMWILDRTHIFAISFIPFYLVIIILVGGIFLMRKALQGIMK